MALSELDATQTFNTSMTAPDLYAGERYVASPEGCYFYHTMDLPLFGPQDGGWDLRGRYLDYIGHVDLKGKRVLDVGAASGFLSFEAERLGATTVVSFDLDTAQRQHLLPFHDSEYVNDHASWCEKQTASFKRWHRSYWLAHRLLRSKVKPRYGDVYRLPADLGRFDVIVVGAILEHLRDPLAALAEMTSVADDLVVINTDFLDTPAPIAAFNGRAARPQSSYIFWTYSIALYDEYMAIMGFKKIVERKDHFPGVRAAPGAPRPMMERVALVYQRN